MLRSLFWLATILTACFGLPAAAVPILGHGTWETTLSGPDINRNAVSPNSSAAVFLDGARLSGPVTLAIPGVRTHPASVGFDFAILA